MSRKRARLAAAPYFREWHMTRTEKVLGTPEEWYVDVPTPLEGAPRGRYWAIELRSVIYRISPHVYVPGAAVIAATTDIACTSGPRTGKLPFQTGCADPDNIWWLHRFAVTPTDVLHGNIFILDESRATNKCDFVDAKGTGKLLMGPHLFIQLSTTDTTVVTTIDLVFEYNFVLVECPQLLSLYASRLNEA